MLDQKRHILPLPGSREGLFFAVVAALQEYGAKRRAGAEPPAVLLPNPFYHVYASSALAVGAEPVFVPATAAKGFMPDYHALDPKLLDRTAFCFLNSPANPQARKSTRLNSSH